MKGGLAAFRMLVWLGSAELGTTPLSSTRMSMPLVFQRRKPTISPISYYGAKTLAVSRKRAAAKDHPRPLTRPQHSHLGRATSVNGQARTRKGRLPESATEAGMRATTPVIKRQSTPYFQSPGLPRYSWEGLYGIPKTASTILDRLQNRSRSLASEAALNHLPRHPGERSKGGGVGSKDPDQQVP